MKCLAVRGAHIACRSPAPLEGILVARRGQKQHHGGSQSSEHCQVACALGRHSQMRASLTRVLPSRRTNDRRPPPSLQGGAGQMPPTFRVPRSGHATLRSFLIRSALQVFSVFRPRLSMRRRAGVPMASWPAVPLLAGFSLAAPWAWTSRRCSTKTDSFCLRVAARRCCIPSAPTVIGARRNTSRDKFGGASWVDDHFFEPFLFYLLSHDILVLPVCSCLCSSFGRSRNGARKPGHFPF